MKKYLVVCLVSLAALGTMATSSLVQQQSVYAGKVTVTPAREAPIAISGDNIYIAWWSNKTGNEETMFRASTDGGATFADKINLSNNPNSDSWKVEINSDADSVVVTWWEVNATSEEPVVRISTDNGATFGPLLKLATNGTISASRE